jgi:hypothetical protein
MRRSAVIMIFTMSLGMTPAAQVQMRQTEPPLVTAENEPWYLEREPVIYAGQRYYPAGALVFFNGNEMVRSGFHGGVPIFTRTTVEPYSLVYIPVGRGLMQPYERPRNGDLAGTVGSRTPSFPVAVATADTAPLPQAAAPPVLVAASVAAIENPAAFVSLREVDTDANARAVATVGTRSEPGPQPLHVRIGDRPSGLNAIFIHYAGARWFSTGQTVEVDPAAMSRIGEYHGFPVWKTETDERILVATSRAGTLAVPYSRENTRLEVR